MHATLSFIEESYAFSLLFGMGPGRNILQQYIGLSPSMKAGRSISKVGARLLNSEPKDSCKNILKSHSVVQISILISQINMTYLLSPMVKRSKEKMT
jgi:hypothetical protein